MTATRYLGTIHGFTFLNALANTSTACDAVAQATRRLRNMFSMVPWVGTHTQTSPGGLQDEVSAMPASITGQPGGGSRVL